MEVINMESNLWCVNKKNIENDIRVTLDLLSKEYKLEELECGEFEKLKIQNMDYTVKCYKIAGVGHLTIMDSRETQGLQMVSIVVTPYYKNLPLLSSDFMYINEKRNFLVEIYDLVPERDEVYMKFIQKFQQMKGELDLPDMKLKENWYDSIRPVCTAKIATPEEDNVILTFIKDTFELFMEMEQSFDELDEEKRKCKWNITQEYTDKLINSGGPSTNLFKAVLGPDKTKEFFDNVFFGLKFNVPS